MLPHEHLYATALILRSTTGHMGIDEKMTNVLVAECAYAGKGCSECAENCTPGCGNLQAALFRIIDGCKHKLELL